MENKIENVYGTNINNGQELIGKVYHETEKSAKGFYIGWEFTLDDIVARDVNQRALQIYDLYAFRRAYTENNATGVIYFPQTNTHQFKTINDTVIYWEYGMTEEDAEKALNAEIQKYTDRKNMVISRISEIIDLLDDADPLLELYDVPTLKRKSKHSTR